MAACEGAARLEQAMIIFCSTSRLEDVSLPKYSSFASDDSSPLMIELTLAFGPEFVNAIADASHARSRIQTRHGEELRRRIVIPTACDGADYQPVFSCIIGIGIWDRRSKDRRQGLFVSSQKIEAHAYIQNTQKWRVDKQNMGTARRIAEPEPAGR